MAAIDRRSFLVGAAVAGVAGVVVLDPVTFAYAADGDQTRTPRYVRAEVRRPQPTATTADTMVALTNPIFLGRLDRD
jgi:hypothetical protein